MTTQTTHVRRRDYHRFRKAVEECDQTLSAVRAALAADAGKRRPLPPAAAWLIDNYAFVHTQVREVREALPAGYYRRLPYGDAGAGGDPRISAIARRLVAAAGGDLAAERIRVLLADCEAGEPLTLAELWALGPLVKLCLLEELCRAARGPLDSADAEAAVRLAIAGLRCLELFPWREVVESLSVTERILGEDPAGVYSGMTFETRDAYRHAVEGLARGSGHHEDHVARAAVTMAREAAAAHSGGREAHVGYYLVGPGLDSLRSRIGYRRTPAGVLREAIPRWPNFFYLSAIAAATAAILAGAAWILFPAPWWYLALLALPASQAAMMAVNRLAAMALPPRCLPRMDFSDGIPPDSKTFVVVPALLISREEVEKLVERLEIHYLANRDPNLFFALLTDFPDSASPLGDEGLLDECVRGVRALNLRHCNGSPGPFYLFHRGQAWNDGESAWMGYERKRGKLNDFNALLRGKGNAFETAVGDLAVLPDIRYVLTLDADTQLPRDTARDLIATLAHPLNRPVIDAEARTVRAGYTILQPRVTVSMESAANSRLARIWAGQPGFDPYTTAVSDVYQDLHGFASFTGKGIYDVAAFECVMNGRFPENTLLSHDLIEGEHARTGLVTDLEVIDDFPSTYESYCKRKHRWVRGDWQIANWLWPRVPDAAGRRVPNPLSLVSRWKILDNLRRSLFEIALLACFLGGWFGLPGRSARAAALAGALLLLPAYTDLLFGLLRMPPRRFWRDYLHELSYRFVRGHRDAFFHLAFLLHQSCLMADAVVRTLIRRFITHRNLLEWQSMAQSERARGGLVRAYLLLCPLAGMALAALLAWRIPADSLAPFLVWLWTATPLAEAWVNGRPYRSTISGAGDADFLRGICLRTWHYFVDFARSEANWLLPDNVREDPATPADRTSPTNLGLQLAADIAARDLGYVTHHELAERLDRTLASMGRMRRWRGHFFNWYDTRTLEVLAPRYVSTVDSGNLAASLLAVKQGCLEMRERPLVDSSTLAGLRDYCRRFREVLPLEAHTGSIVRLLDSLVKQLEHSPTDLFFWEGVLSEALGLTARLEEPVEWVCARLEECGGGPELAEIRYWYGRLADRTVVALDELRTLAPWLADPYETELRLSSSDESLAEVMRELCRVPSLSRLPEQYEAIAGAIERRLGSPHSLHSSTRRVLVELLAEIAWARPAADRLIARFETAARTASRWVDEMDFAFLFDRKRKLLRIGCDVDSGVPDAAHYDLLASEARTAVFVAIAKGDVPREAWFRLGRKLTPYRGYRTLLSWSGTMFEYLMPALFIKTYDRTLLGASARDAVRIQQEYGREHAVPWGVSEAASGARDHALNYQYRAFGIPALATNPRHPDGLVIAPYAAMLAVMVDRPAASRNLRWMAADGWTGRYGFYESMDFSPRWERPGDGPSLVRSYMVHHQAMGLLALTNALLDGPMQKRFHADPLVEATEYLLQERPPALHDRSQERESALSEPEMPEYGIAAGEPAA